MNGDTEAGSKIIRFYPKLKKVQPSSFASQLL